jgi:hypothetical protein
MRISGIKYGKGRDYYEELQCGSNHQKLIADTIR